MKHIVSCPRCGSIRLTAMGMSQRGDGVQCLDCDLWSSEEDLLRHMRKIVPAHERNKPAFRLLDVKARGRSTAAKAVFG